MRAAMLVPWAIITVVSATMWKLMYNDVYGVFNDLLVDKLDRCVKKHKEKKRDHHATEAQRTARNLASL